jgi:hypothetical protein
MEGKGKKEIGKAKWVIALFRFSFFLLPFSFLVIGCRPKGPPPGQPKAYFGPTEPLADVVDAINQNNRKLPTLWAEVDRMRATFVDDRGKWQDETLDGGNLLYQAPRSVRVLGDKIVLGNVVEIGSNDETYWFAVKEGPKTAWWGRYQNLGKPCSDPIPIRPDLVLEVLGISTIETDLTRLPAPVMRFNSDADAYMLVWNAKLPDRWIAVKEVWYDRQTKRPKLVNLFDADGRVVLRAYLAQHKPVELANLPKEQWPVVATDYDLFFPETGSKLRLWLGQVKLSNRGAPSARTFNFSPEPKRLGVSKVIQLDARCGP